LLMLCALTLRAEPRHQPLPSGILVGEPSPRR
jgi:hypothetical protein